MKHPFWRAFSWTLGVYLLGIALAVWVIEPPGAPAGEPVREAVQSAACVSPRTPSDDEENCVGIGRSSQSVRILPIIAQRFPSDKLFSRISLQIMNFTLNIPAF